MTILKYFVVVLMLLDISNTYAQNDQNKWLVEINAYDINYHPVNAPFSGFFNTENNSLIPPLSNFKIAYSLKNWLSTYLDVSLGEVKNQRWSTNNSFFLKLSKGFRIYPLPKFWFSPFFQIGSSYHRYHGYRGNHLTILSKTYYTERRNFLLWYFGGGINFWFSRRFGINFQSIYNKVLKSNKDFLDFWQHSAGIVFRFGQHDKDKDDIPDEEDVCPIAYGLSQFNGCPDTDGDKVSDDKDECPNAFGKKETLGCPDIDNDNIPFFQDKCQMFLGSFKVRPYTNKVSNKLLNLKKITFDVKTTHLRHKSLSILKKCATVLNKTSPNVKIYIYGPTDRIEN